MNEINNGAHNQQSLRPDETEALIDDKDEVATATNDVAEDEIGFDILPPFMELIESEDERPDNGEPEILNKELNNNGANNKRNSVKRTSSACSNEWNNTNGNDSNDLKDYVKTAGDIRETHGKYDKDVGHIDKKEEPNNKEERHNDKEAESVDKRKASTDKEAGLREVCEDVIIRETFIPLDAVDGNWISREACGYDTVDTRAPDDVDVEQPKDRTVCGRMKYTFEIVKASIVPIASVAVFAYDIGGDVELAAQYRSSGELTYFWITVACITVPAILMSCVDIVWVIMDKHARSTKFKWQDVCRIVIGGLSLGRLVRACACAVHTIQAIRKPHQRKHTLKADVKRLDEAMLNFISAFTEDIIMLSVQLYLHFTSRVELAVSAHSLAGSTLGIAWTYSSLYRDGRKARRQSRNVRLFGFLVFFVAALAALAAREIAIVFFIIYVKIWTSAVVLFVHFGAMYIWLCRQHRDEGGERSGACAKCLYLSFFAYVSVFNFINVKNGEAAKRMIVFYVILYLESFIMAGVAFSKIQQRSDYDSNIVYYLLALPVGFVVHVIFTGVYYSFFHPNFNTCCKCDIDL